MRDKEMIAVFHYDDGGSNMCGAEPYRYAEEIVRCKECKWSYTDERDGIRWCKVHISYYRVNADGFCNYGERSE